MKKKRKLGRKLLSFLLTLALVLGLMPGMGLTAYAAPTETLLTTITGAGSNTNPATSANVSYSTEGMATLTFSEPTSDGQVAYQASPAWGWWGYAITLTVTPAEGYTITKCVFYDDANRTATDSEAPFIVETAWNDKTPKVNGAVINYSSKGIKKIEVYGYATPAATHSVNITAGDHMTKTAGSGDAEQTGLTGAMTDVVYTADNGYYYPTNYSVAEVSGIKVTRNSYTQITVSGTPTADAAITLTAPTAKSKETTPSATFTATGADTGTLASVANGMKYSLDGTNWTDINDSADINLTELSTGTIQVVKKGNGTTTVDSDPQTITVSKAETPNLTVTQPTVIGGKGTVATTTAHEYSSDNGSTWTACTANQEFEAGSYLIRVKANGTALASGNQSVTITAFVPGKETTPSATFTATGADTGTLASVANGMKYSLDGTNWTDINDSADINLTELSAGTIQVVKKGNGTTTVDSDPQTITVSKAETPNLTVTQPTVIGGKGTVATTTAHEYSSDNGSTWTACNANQEFEAGSYLIRVKANGTALASGNQSVTITAFVPGKETTPSATFTATGADTGTLASVANGMKYSLDGTNWTDINDSADINLTELSAGTIQVVKKGNGTTTVDSDPQTITVSKAETPNLTVTQPTVIGGKGTVATMTAHEYSSDNGSTWTACTANQEFAADSYLIRVKANGTALASGNQTVTIKAFISATVTFKVVNGSWNEGEGEAATANKTVTLTGYEGDTLKLSADQIPAVGNKPSETYKAGSWDVTPSTETAITENTTYTYTYAAKEASVVTKVPEAKTLTYNGSAQELVTAGTATGGTMQYAIGTKDAATEPYTTSIPTATDAETYYVWYMVKGDDDHKDTEAECVEATILADISKTVTFKVVNGSWDDGTTEDKKVTLKGFEGDTLKLASSDIPKVGSKPDDKYVAGEWDTEPSTSEEITADKTFTYTYLEKEEEQEETPADIDVTPADDESKEESTDDQSPYRTEWVDGQWYNSEGNADYKPQGKWYQDEYGWWYEDESGWNPTGQWQKIDGKWYYFTSDGYMDYSEYRDGYWLGADGAWNEKHFGGRWYEASGMWWYEDASGWYPTNQWLWINWKCYYFDSDGYRARNQYIDGFWVNNDGEWEP